MSPPSDSPNLLLIIVDQQRWDCLGHVRPDLVSTPNLDELATQGARFSNAFSHMPVCCPARQSLLAGERPERFGALWNYDIGLPTDTLSPEVRTWPVELRESGYRTSYFGKWHVSNTASPLDFGYQEYVGLEDQRAARAAFGAPSLATSPWEGMRDSAPQRVTAPHWFAERASRWMKMHCDEPWHLRLDFEEPHLPSCPVEPYATKYSARRIPPWPNFADPLVDKPYIQRQQRLNWRVDGSPWATFEPMVANYLAMIEQVDDAIGRVLEALEEAGCSERTLVVYTADHGDLGGAHGMMDKHYVMYDEVVRVPLILRWPGQIPAGQRVDQLVYNFLDLAPTIADVLSLPVPSRYQGRNLAPLINGSATPTDWRSEIAATYNGQQFGLYTQRMLRDERWKYIWNASDVDELYDLTLDPHELENLAGRPEHIQVLTEMRKRLYHLLLREGDTQVAGGWVEPQLLEGMKLPPGHNPS